ncbi:hypothetical protein [Aeromonas hydrophila]|uniref:hypothetical protein n=1 Tax=Aeromonas hydrophila TaxID=644 RepID=UPI000A921BF6|nr:hypothetical protein [Aeromonas hydrophila]MBM0513960.1 hypothetical protein [Aeromonas hydrophila]MBW3773990.1 hypothetical protein [Aeromonas hydrophila]MCP3287107.1 hypothetical protein [Aeromonas hydrophila]HAT1546853.1 hypothetical protein [Aeromonas hydrophila]HAT1556885.1 hypothetical protein [Aeromonas hydrophila]
MKKALFICLFVFCSSFFASQSAVANDDCKNSSGVHQEMVSCLQKQTDKYEVNLKNIISSKSSDYGFSKSFYDKQRLAIHEKCMLYSNVGGQRGELLMVQCELDGVKNLNEYINQYIDDVNNS